MEIGGLQNDSLQAWVPFDDDTEVLIEYQSPEQLTAIRKKATKVGFVKHQKGEEYDSTEGNRLLGRQAVKDWRPFPDRPGFTMSGQSYPYTPQNCDFLMRKWNSFAEFVNTTVTDLGVFVAEEKEREKED
jgi:hypothetical protein